jgi:hypothetical protein
MQTQREKATYLGGTFRDTDLPERYRQEVDHPVRASQSAAVYVTELGNSPVGVVVVQ